LISQKESESDSGSNPLFGQESSPNVNADREDEVSFDAMREINAKFGNEPQVPKVDVSSIQIEEVVRKEDKDE
jgi:hypothetical protein